MMRMRDIVKLRRWCIRRRGEGVPVSEICTLARIPRRTFYNWMSRFEEGGFENLIDKPRKPNTIHRTPIETVNRIVALREETGWCPHRIAGHLGKSGLDICHTTVYRILCQEGLNNPLTRPRTKRTYKRWQRRRINSLWQYDLKQVGVEWLITILDDHSRFVTASHFFKEGTAENVIWLLDKAIHEYRKPREILTDHGSQFYSVRRRIRLRHIL